MLSRSYTTPPEYSLEMVGIAQFRPQLRSIVPAPSWQLAAFTVMAMLICAFAQLARGQEADAGAWEFRVCADPDGIPFSNEDRDGFENRIAAVLAEELNARLTYDWYPQGPDMITYRLRAGLCDVIIGIPDGVGDVLHTVAYYRSPYVFVYRQDSPFRIESLDDPVLEELRIAVQHIGIPPHDALVSRGLSDNVVSDYLEGNPRVGLGRSRAAIDAVVAGQVDVALAWGPVAGWLSRQSDVELVIEPVTPEFEPPFRSQSFPMTMGVRPGDEALRHRLDVALADRWEEITTILEEYGVPLGQLPAPVASPRRPGQVFVGFATPTLTGASAIPESLYDIAGQAAANGALLAESDVGVTSSDSEFELDVLFASTPSPEAAKRAAQRLVASEEVVALLGGLGEGQAEELEAVAAANGIPFLNIGSPRLARTCTEQVFHVEASAGMYLSAIADWFDEGGDTGWFIISEEGVDGESERLARLAEELIVELGGQVLGAATTARAQPSYVTAIDEAQRAGAGVVLSLLHPRDQIALMGQAGDLGLDAEVVPFPDPVTQTREFLSAATFAARTAGAGDRVLLWETTLEGGFGGELNDSFTSRWGQPMDPSAWAGYAGVKALHDAIVLVEDDRPAKIAEGLREVVLELGKGEPLSFYEETQQLGGPLYVVEVDADAGWGVTVSRMIAVAELIGQFPSPSQDDSGTAGGWPDSAIGCEEPLLD